MRVMVGKILNMAKLAWTFDLSPGEGMTSADVDDDIDTAYLEGFLIAPKKFPIRIVPRSERHRRVVERELEGMRSFWDQYEE